MADRLAFKFPIYVLFINIKGVHYGLPDKRNTRLHQIVHSIFINIQHLKKDIVS